ncbi:MAG TPA: DUF6069 family protein [Pseudonocardiaceae bacterium]|jgi:hypothetical protein
MSQSPEQLSSGGSRRHGEIGIAAAVLATVVAVAVAGNTLVAVIAAGLGAPAGFAPLTLPVYGGFTAIGVVAGWLGWRFVQRRVARPHLVLTALVPLVSVLSMAPDLLLFALRFIPGTTPAGVFALMTMHIVVVLCAVPGYAIASHLLHGRAVVVTPAVAAA